MKRSLVILTLTASLGFASSAIAQHPPVKSSKTPATTLKWTKPMGDQGPEMSVVYGDPTKGPAGFFLKIPAGVSSGWHIHDADYTSIVVQGTHNHLVQGEKAGAPALPQGSWFSQAAKENHIDECGKDGPCILFIHMNGPMTFTPKTADGKDVPAAKDTKAKK